MAIYEETRTRMFRLRLLANDKIISMREGDAWALINNGLAIRMFDAPKRDKMMKRQKCKVAG